MIIKNLGIAICPGSDSSDPLENELMTGFEDGVSWRQIRLFEASAPDSPFVPHDAQVDSARRIVRVAAAAARRMEKYGTKAALRWNKNRNCKQDVDKLFQLFFIFFTATSDIATKGFPTKEWAGWQDAPPTTPRRRISGGTFTSGWTGVDAS